jgi:hypothetical protein
VNRSKAREHPFPSHGLGDLRALLRRARVHPDGGVLTREDPADLADQRLRGIEGGEGPLRGLVQVDAAVLLAGPRHGADPGEIDPAVLRDVSHDRVERLGPHLRRGPRDERVLVRKDAVLRPVRGEALVEAQGLLIDDPPAIPLNFNRDDREALRAGVEAEVYGHALFSRIPPGV